MRARTARSTRTALTGSAIAVAVALLATACSSSSTGKAPSGVPVAAGGSAAAGAAAGTIGLRSGPLGSYLADGTGRSLYLFTSDGANSSSCTSTCSTYWPALAGNGKPAAATGVNAGLLATFARSDGARQVSYDGHPLYYFALDSAAGDTKGQGLNDFGAKWWLVDPSGKPITGGSSAAAPTGSSGGSNGGGGYGGYGG